MAGLIGGLFFAGYMLAVAGRPLSGVHYVCGQVT
jgi:hypothetical protein